jgi:molybdopterin synthase catalytic subunit
MMQGPGLGMFRITSEPINLLLAIGAVSGRDRGAVATFCGVVRDHHQGRPVLGLEYHAYAPMAERLFAEIAAQAARRHPGVCVAVIHRVGTLRIGDLSVVVAVASAHRAAALAACSYVIDEVKARAPIWKKEFFQDGVVWLEGPDGCGTAGS